MADGSAELLQSLFHIAGQAVVLTGGGGILCGTLARGLARLGARIGVVDIRVDAAQKVANDIVAQGGEALALQADVLDRASLESAASAFVERFGVVDALISGAGGNSARATTSREAGFFDLPCEAFCDVMGLNVVGTVLPVQVFGSYMARQGRGRIVNIVSVIAERPLTNVPAYAAGKAAVKNFTQWLAVHVSHNYSTDIRVNGLAPGFFLTDQNRYLLTDAETGEPTERGKTIIDHTPLGRYGDPEELLAAVLWLLSPGASFVHGATIVVDGGFTAFSGV